MKSLRIKRIVAILFALGTVIGMQALPAFADYNYSGVIQTAAPVQGAAAVLNAAGCGNPARVIQWSFTTASCSGGGSNEKWNIDVTAAEAIGGSGTDIWAYYNGNYMCLNVAGGNYSSGTQIYAWNCDPSNGGVTSNEKFKLEPCGNTGACGASYGLIAPANEPTGANLCLNIAGGFGNGNNVTLYACSPSYQNELFTLPGW